MGSETIQLSYVIGKLSFIDMPKVYERGSVVEGKVSPISSSLTIVLAATKKMLLT